MSNWLNDLESKLKTVLVNAPDAAQPKKESANGNLTLFVLVLLMICGLYFTWKYKFVKINQPIINRQLSLEQRQAQKIEELQRQYDGLDATAKKIWDRTKWSTDRVTLLAIINNHNLIVLQQNLPRNELIFLNEDWTINRLPDHVTLTEKNEEFVKKFVR